MRTVRTIAVMAGLLVSLGANARNAIEPLPRDLEIQLALSALPPHLRDAATVYVLNPARGFEVARQGTNGFHAFVARTGDDTFRGEWPLTKYRGRAARQLVPLSHPPRPPWLQHPVSRRDGVGGGEQRVRGDACNIVSHERSLVFADQRAVRER